MEVTFELRRKERLGFSWGTEVGYGKERTSRGNSMYKGPVAGETGKDCMTSPQRARLRADQ